MKILKDIIEFWVETWNQSKLLFFLEMFGTIASMTAGLYLSLDRTPSLVSVFIMYTIGSTCLLYVTYRRRSSWMVFMFTFFTISNTIGLINHSFG